MRELATSATARTTTSSTRGTRAGRTSPAKPPTYGFSQTQSPGSNTGSFFFNPALWDSFDEIAIGFKFGTGNQPDEWFVYLLQGDVSSGLWEFVNVFGKGGGLSHLTFYAGEGTTTVPEPATLLLFGLGLLSLGFARRKKA